MQKKYAKEKQNIVFSNSNVERIYSSSELLAYGLLIKNNFYIEQIGEDTYLFLKEFRDLNFTTTEEFLKKHKIENKEHNEENEIKESQDKYDPDNKKFRCNDGHIVRSKAEREIDNFFYANNIQHTYEYHYEHPVTKEWAIPDFYLPKQNLFIEYFGLNTPDYVEKREHKIKMYRSDKSINFEYLTHEDDADLRDKLLKICREYNIQAK